jgi:hypothetical protein
VALLASTNSSQPVRPPSLFAVDTTQWFRKLLHESTEHAGSKERSPKSAKQIKSFVEFFGIDMNQFTPSDINAYKVRTTRTPAL